MATIGDITAVDILMRMVPTIPNSTNSSQCENGCERRALDANIYCCGECINRRRHSPNCDAREFLRILIAGQDRALAEELRLGSISEVRYLTDDRDEERRNELSISRSGNGDWYVATAPEGTGTMGRAVRICTSGGAARAVPGLGRAIANAFRAIARANGQGITHVSIR